MVNDDETEAANQMEVATEAIREAVLRLLQEGEVDPQFVVLAAAGVTGELGADIARIGDVDLETVLGDLADLVREAGRAHAEDLAGRRERLIRLQHERGVLEVRGPVRLHDARLPSLVRRPGRAAVLAGGVSRGTLTTPVVRPTTRRRRGGAVRRPPGQANDKPPRANEEER